MESLDIQSVKRLQVQLEIEQLIEIARLHNLKKVERLGHSVAVVVPSTIDENVPTDTSFHAEQAKQFMVELFGGVSCLEQEGLYRSLQGEIIREKSILVRSYATTQALHQHFPMLLCFVGYLQRQLRQETMALEIDAEMLLLQFDK